MRDAKIITIACVLAIAVGVWLYLSATPLQGPEIQSTGPVSFSVLVEGEHSGTIEEQKNFRIKNESDFYAVWEQMYPTEEPPLPEVDFEHQEVLAVFDGVRPTGGYDVEVASVVDNGSARHIVINRIMPADDCVSTQALTSPYEIIVVPKTSLPIERQENIVTESCGG